MREALVVVSGLLAGVVLWIPFGVGLAAHRYKLGGAILKSTNKWVLLAAAPPGSYSLLGKLGFVVLVLIWLVVFFGAMAIPALVAKLLQVPEASPSVMYAVYANLLIGAVAFIAGPAIWRRLAL
ncbi:hypothetical protein [Azonexus sp. R2A61]|uniref:hypothetical protein n=1 Tax=Azonexus sp. R2A61 TaxID=2744443 RepID=UPI001F315540|nr:hypothetical protein [Azonexus sp. R2A61]